MVVATIALFVALGGGYAMAFKGSGTLQKGAADSLPTTFTDVRSLIGFGVVQARCTGEEVAVRIRNTSSHAIAFVGQNLNGNVFSNGAQPGDAQVFPVGEGGLLRLHLSRVNTPGSKAQVDLTVNADAVDACEFSHARVLALNTQQ